MEGILTIANQQSDPLEETDDRLVREAKKGSRESFDRLVLRYQRRVYSITMRMTGNHDDADDLAQDTFLATYRAIERFDEQQSFAAFVSRIAINLSINHLRRRKRWLKIQTQKKEDATQELMGSNWKGPHEQMEHRELLARAQGAIQTLPPHQKAVLVLKVYQRMSYEEIATTLKISMGTVMSRLHRARERLRAELKDVL